MPAGDRFHLSMYVTLGLACAALGYAELAFLPEISFLAAIVGLLLVVAYRLEGRWSLSTRGANWLGAGIALAAGSWVVHQYFRPYGGTLLDSLPWPTSLLPYLGPLLMILVPAKLFRPKLVGDFWGLQIIGLIAVALACALAGDTFFGVLMIAYLVSAMWSLTLFYLFRSADEPRVAAPPRPLRRSAGWAVAVVGLALALFLLTPRSGDARWELTVGGKIQTGYNDERPNIDLNRSGTLKVNRDLVFKVVARTGLDRDERKLDLDPGIRWRGATFNYYDNGRWENRGNERVARGQFPGEVHAARLAQTGQLPDLGPKQYFLEYEPHLRSVAHAHFLAEPIWAVPVGAPDRRVPVVSLTDRRQQMSWYNNMEDELHPPALSMSSSRHVYKQVLRPAEEAGLSLPVRADESLREHLCNSLAVPRLGTWTRALLQRLCDAGQLPAAALGVADETDETPRVPPEHYEAVARAFESYLSLSGDFHYSLTLSRANDDFDPVEDFVLNTRRGHCSRFASALAMMLRTQGVPARIVLGFRGYDDGGDGVYEVRQCHAHSWVEALVQRTENGRTTWRWRTLDPTPGSEEVESIELTWGNWWEFSRQGAAAFFKNFIVEYDADQQGRARSAFSRFDWKSLGKAGTRLALGADGSQWWRPMIVVGAVASGVLLWRRRRTGRTSSEPTTAFHGRLLEMLRRRLRLAPTAGQTAEEFATVAASRLRVANATAGLADVPSEAAVMYYRVRYGRQSLDAGERANLDRRLSTLDAALKAAPG